MYDIVMKKLKEMDETITMQTLRINKLEDKCSESEQKIKELEKKLKQVEHTAEWAFAGLGLK